MLKKTFSVLFALAFLALAVSCSGGGGGSEGSKEISSWASVDNTTSSGINKNTAQTASTPQLTAFGSKLYATWRETATGAAQIRVAVYNGDDNSPLWTFVDGNGANGINRDVTRDAGSPQLTVLGSKLYATWHELNNAGILQIRVAVYNGDDSSPLWTFVDGNGANGINKDVTHDAGSPQLTVLGSKLYTTWWENNGSAYEIRAAVYNGNDGAPAWTFVDGNGTNGINKDATKDADSPQLTAFGAKLYAAWNELNNTGVAQVRVAVYNGNDNAPSWTFVDGNGANGINRDATKDVEAPQLTVVGSKLYAAWNETGLPWSQIRVALYNGNDSAPTWTFVDGNGTTGINKDTGGNAWAAQLTSLGSKLYATWFEQNGAGVTQIRAAVYNGNDGSPSWAFVDGNGANGINRNTGQTAYEPQLTAFGSKLYAIWRETDGAAYQVHVAVGQ